jgi:hypothetical protein
MANLEAGHEKSLAVVTPDILKRASLLFDKVILVQLQTESETDMVRLDSPPPDWFENVLTVVPHPPFRFTKQEPSVVKALGRVAEVLVASECYAAYDLVPMYTTGSDLLSRFSDGQFLVVQVALRGIPEVIEDETPWEQIAGFRRDRPATAAYRSLRRLMRSGKEIGSVAEAEDLISTKLQDYDRALKKPGLKTTVGCIQLLIAATVGVGAYVSREVFAVLAAGLTFSTITVQFLERRIDLAQERTKTHSEIEIVHQARRLADP